MCSTNVGEFKNQQARLVFLTLPRLRRDGKMNVFVYVDGIWRQVCSCRCYLESCLCMDISAACEVLLHAYSTSYSF